MNAAELERWVTEHKMPVIGGAAAAVAGLALLRKRQAVAAGPNADPAGADAGSYVGESQFRPYDSTSNDVYNALQPQMEAMQRAIEGLTVSAVVPTPVPTPPATPASPASPYTPYASLLTRYRNMLPARPAPRPAPPVRPMPLYRLPAPVAPARTVPSWRGLIPR